MQYGASMMQRLAGRAVVDGPVGVDAAVVVDADFSTKSSQAGLEAVTVLIPRAAVSEPGDVIPGIGTGQATGFSRAVDTGTNDEPREQASRLFEGARGGLE
jgi:hypothetical protein